MLGFSNFLVVCTPRPICMQILTSIGLLEVLFRAVCPFSRVQFILWFILENELRVRNISSFYNKFFIFSGTLPSDPPNFIKLLWLIESVSEVNVAFIYLLFSGTPQSLWAGKIKAITNLGNRLKVARPLICLGDWPEASKGHLALRETPPRSTQRNSTGGGGGPFFLITLNPNK
jgi:hypothetical protein